MAFTIKTIYLGHHPKYQITIDNRFIIAGWRLKSVEKLLHFLEKKNIKTMADWRAVDWPTRVRLTWDFETCEPAFPCL